MAYHKPVITDREVLETYKAYRNLISLPYDLTSDEKFNIKFGTKNERWNLNTEAINNLAKGLNIDKKLLRSKLRDIMSTLAMRRTRYSDFEYFCTVCAVSDEPYYLSTFMRGLSREFDVRTKDEFHKITREQVERCFRRNYQSKIARICANYLGYTYAIPKNNDSFQYEICINTICNGELNVPLTNNTYSERDAQAINCFLNELNKHLGEGIDSIYLVKKIEVKHES